MGKLGTILGILAVIFAFIPLLMALITGWGYHLPGNTFALQRFLGVNLALPCLTIGLALSVASLFRRQARRTRWATAIGCLAASVFTLVLLYSWWAIITLQPHFPAP